MNATVTTYLHMLRLFSRDVRMYLLTSALLGLSYFGFMAVLLNLYLLRLGYGPAFIGLVNGSTALAFAASSLLAGAIGSRWGYRRTVVVGIGMVSAGVILLPLAEFLPEAWRNSGILIIRLGGGFGFALYSVNANPYLVAATTPAERNYVFSIQVALLSLAGFAGNLVAGMMPTFFATRLNLPLDHPAPYRYPLIIAGVLLMPAVVALFTTQEISGEDQPADIDQKTSAAPYLIIAFLALTGLFRMAGEGAARAFFNVYLDAGLGVSTATIGILTAISQILATPSALVAPLLVMHAGKVRTIVLATLGIAASLLLMALIPHWVGIGLGFMGVISMLSITRAVTSVLQMEIVPADWRATTSGLTSMAMGMGFSSITLGGGYIISALGYRSLFLIGAGMATTSALLFWAYFRIPRGEYARQGTTTS